MGSGSRPPNPAALNHVSHCHIVVCRVVVAGAALGAKQFRVQDLLAKVQCLVGHFRLDPHRVGALLVDAFEGEMENPRYVRLLKAHQVVPVASVLGFQFRYYGAAERDARAGLRTVPGGGDFLHPSPLQPHDLA